MHTKRITGKHIRTILIQTELFFSLGFDEAAQFLGIVKRKYRRGLALHHLTSSILLHMQRATREYTQTILVEPNLRHTPHGLKQYWIGSNEKKKKNRQTIIFQMTSPSPVHITQGRQLTCITTLPRIAGFCGPKTITSMNYSAEKSIPRAYGFPYF